MKQERQTVGSLSTDLQLKQTHAVSVIDQMRENLTDFEKNVHECVETHKSKFPNDFFVIVITKKERLMENVIRNYFFARLTCPTPDYDQIVYKYDSKNDHIQFIWVIPSRDTCFLLIENWQQVTAVERELLNFIMKFKMGKLMKLAQELNKEIQMAPEEQAYRAEKNKIQLVS
jgi:hypothetical protein